MNLKQKLVYTALGGLLVFMGLLLSHTFSGDVIAQWKQNDPPANITASEYLNLFFPLHMHEHRTYTSLSVVTVYFNDRGEGMLYINSDWDDKSVNQLELKRYIRQSADLMVKEFKRLSESPNVKKRWSPSKPLSRFIIRHARAHDLRETLAVTLDGVTYFDVAKFQEAKQKVKVNRGFWYE